VSEQALAELSNNALYSATVVYALALLAHAWEWAMARQLPDSTVEPSSQQHSGALLGRSRTVGVAGSAPDPRVPVTTAIRTPSKDGAANPLGQEGVEERSDRFGRVGLGLTMLAALLHLVGVVARGLAADRVPWGSMYEFAITGSFMVVAAYLVLLSRYPVRWLGLFVTGFVTAVLGVAVLVLYRPVGPLVPALHSYWLVIHVFAAALAGGAFTVGALASVAYLLRRRAESRAADGPSVERRGFVWRLPDAESIDRVAYRLHAFGFPIWTFAVLAGAIWAEYAWGRFWGWDPKEVWAFITWVVYAAYLHARATAGWRGKGAAVIALVGFATFLFNFVGINLFGSGLHSYAGM
jgi:cytochrome c-type biogenesis protein CcsB